MRLTIPEPFSSSLQAFLKMEDGDVEQLSKAFNEAKPALGSSALANQVSASLSSAESKGVAQAVAAMYRVQSVAGVSKSRFVDDVLAHLSSVSDEKFSEQDKERYKARLDKVLTPSESMEISAKANDVLTSHERSFCEAKILTEVRPVFNDDVDGGPSVAVLVHMLQIGFHRNNEHEEFFVALDTADIKKLRRVLDRADSKAEQIGVMLSKAGVEYLDVEEDE